VIQVHHLRTKISTALALLCLASAAASAAKPRSWNFSTQRDFAKGKFDGTVVDSYGNLTLGRQLVPVELGKDAQMVGGLVETDAPYAAVNESDGPKIYRLDGKKGREIFKAPEGFTEISALAADKDGNLLIALSGERARLVRLSTKPDAKPTTVFEHPDAASIWDITITSEGVINLATGPEGKVYRVTPDEKEPTVLLETPSKNATTLALDKNNNLLVGTSGKGLVIRVDAKTQKPFVLLDAGNVDITALLTDKTGNIYAATAKSQPDEQQPDEDEPDTKSKPSTTEPEPVDPGASHLAPGLPGVTAPTPIDPQFPHPVLAINDDLTQLKKLLADAEKEKTKPPATKKAATQKRNKKPRQPKPEAPESDEGEHDVNAIYRITPDGSSRIIVQESDANFALALDGNDLLIGTGNEGKLYRFRPADESLALLARLNQESITSILTTKSAEVLIGTANGGAVYRLGNGLATTGTYTSDVLDATHAATWGQIAARTANARGGGGKISIATRSGNTRANKDKSEKFWSDWSSEIPIDPAAPSPIKIDSPSARDLQFRITLTATDKDSPALSALRIPYLTENLPPRIDRVSVDTGNGGSDSEEPAVPNSEDADTPTISAQVSWEASDPNGDDLLFRVLLSNTADKTDTWTPLAKDIRESVYEWDTRGVADGVYQVKIIASDKLDNPDPKETARVSGRFTIDHTPPTRGELAIKTDGNKVHIAGEAKDATSAIADVRYQIDGQGDWQPAAASDKIFDSAQESFTIVTPPLSAAGHRITVRAVDAQGNAAYKTVTVTVKPG
jgi:sugar lactone lactonase YvrE